MRRGVWLVTLAAAWGAETASAQVSLSMGGSASLPVGGFGDVANVGAMGFGGAMLQLGQTRLAVGVEALYGRNAHQLPGNRSSLFGGRALLRYAVVERELVAVFVAGEVGTLRHSRTSEPFPGIDASELGVTAGVAATVSVSVAGPLVPFVGAGYTRGLGGLNTSAFPTELLEFRGGVMIPLGA